MSPNPFSPGKPVSPESFVGRTAQLATAFDQIHNRSSLAIWSGSGLGKTSFLKNLASPQMWLLHGLNRNEAVIVEFNCLDIRPFQPSEFWRTVLKRLKNEVKDDTSLMSDIDILLAKAEVKHDDLEEVLQKIGEQNKFLVLLLDDYDATLRQHEDYTEADIEDFVFHCRYLAYSGPQSNYLSTIVTSSRRLNDLGPKLTPDKSPWYNHYEFESLKPFTEQEVAALFAGMLMTPALREKIPQLADGNPALLQNAGNVLYKKLRIGEIPNPNEFTEYFFTSVEHFFQQIWQLSNQEEQTLLMLLALSKLKGRLPNQQYDLGNIDRIFSQRERELEDLEKRGVIKKSVEQGKNIYSFASALMEFWVIKEIQNSNEEEIQNRQKVFLNLMSHKQAEQFKNTIRFLWNNTGNILSTILQAIGNL